MEDEIKPSQKKVASYYDGLWADVERKGLAKPNSRHRTIFKYLVNNGLNKSSSVLEVGCGNGVLTRMIMNRATNGNILGVDLSDETIAMLQQKYSGKKNVKFMVSDMSSLDLNTKFDFLVLPDVIEHIPMEQHLNMFKTLRQLAHDDSIILINIPEPRWIEWAWAHRKDLLQIIDQPVHTNQLMANVYANGFYIEFLKSYSLYFNPIDYQVMVLKVRSEKGFQQKTKWQQIIAEAKSRIPFWK